MQNIFMSHFLQFSSGSFDFLALNLDLPGDIGNFKALLRFSEFNACYNKVMREASG